MVSATRSSFLRQLHRAVQIFGVDPVQTWHALAELPYYIATAFQYSKRAKRSAFPFDFRSLRPMLHDRHAEAGTARGHYFFQDIWAARKIVAMRPRRHVDIGSSIHGFIAHVLCFMPVDVIDIRPLTTTIDGLRFVQGDATHLSNINDDSIESLSSLHAVEHFGLGRYGDHIDPEACFHAMRAISRVLEPGGRLYFSVPVGAQRVQFNSQRIFNPRTVVAAFANLKLLSFAGVDDDGIFHSRLALDALERARCALGLFEFTK